MEDQRKFLSPADIAELEESILNEYNDRFRPQPYRPIFSLPTSGPWAVEGDFPDNFFNAAHLLIEGITKGHLNGETGGIPAVFLVRHYAELKLKYLLFHSRWLKDVDHNALDHEIDPVGKSFGHDLLKVWTTFRRELSTRCPGLIPASLDFAFADEFVTEFSTVDRRNDRFRYPGEELPVPSIPNERLKIDFEALLFGLQRVHDVFETLDSYLIERFGENADWEAEQQSWM